ncbi:MAG: 30S ribosomal protein S9, partial [Microcella pacifica]
MTNSDSTSTDAATEAAPSNYSTESTAPVAEAAPRAILSVSGAAVGRRKQAIARVRIAPGAG